MRIFVTGATGFIGSATVRELLDAGHEVVGLARSDQAAASLPASGAKVRRGSLEDLESLRAGAAESDGVVHTAYIHDFTDFAAAAATDLRAVTAIGEALIGSDRPFVIASGIVVEPGSIATEESVPAPGSPAMPRFASEEAMMSFAKRGVRASIARFAPTVHGKGDHGFVPRLIDIARAKGVSAYPGDGANRWPTVHRLDAAHLLRLAVEAAPAGTRLHGVGEEGVAVREIAEAIGRNLKLPVAGIPLEDAAGHFGFLGGFFSMDLPATSAATQKLLGWRPVQPGLIADLDEGHYFNG
jgi:nucleoside-diphosphate-sugar epimerase